MADPNKETDNFVEVDGVKYKEDPEKEGEALIGDDGEFVPFEEKPEETEEEKKAREKEEEEERKREEGEEPPTRRSAASQIIKRQKIKIKKLREKKEGDEEEELEEELEEGAEEVTPAGKKAIKKQIEGAMGPIIKSVKTQSDEQELKDVFAKYPGAKDMEKQIRKYMDSDVYKGVAVEFIFLGLAAKKMKLDEKRKEADEEAKGDALGGHGRRKKDLSPIPDVRKMGDKEIDDLIIKVKTGQV